MSERVNGTAFNRLRYTGAMTSSNSTSGSPAQRSVDALFADLQALQAQRKAPPVHLWHPEREGEIDIKIQRDGSWWHEGSMIKRPELVQLFASILRLDDDGFWLVTPAERLRIEVEDAPFVAVDLDVRHPGSATQTLLFTTNVDEYVVVDADHKLKVIDTPSGPHPYIEVRAGLQALITRAVFYRLVEYGQEFTEVGYAGKLWVCSDGERYCLGEL